MQEYTSSGATEVDPNKNVAGLLWEAEAAMPDQAVLAYRDGDAFVDVTMKELATKVRRIAAGFMALGIEPGSRISLYSPSRVEFTYFDYAIWAAGCATVAIYETSSADQVDWIVGNSGSVATICSSQAQVDTFNESASQHEANKHVYCLDTGGMEALMELGKDISDEQVLARSNMAVGSDLATLVYTSGTTGRPKGCELTHNNFVWAVGQVGISIPEILNKDASTLMFLPLAHIFSRLIQVISVSSGAKIAFSTGIPQLLEELQMVKPTWIFSVPRVLEKVYNGAAASAADDGKGKIFQASAATAIAYGKARQAGRIPMGLKLKYNLFNKLVYPKLRHAFGGNVTHVISGAAALGERLGFFYDAIGIKVFEGYGLTETTAGSTVNREGEQLIGSVGRPIPGVSVRIAEDGEILIKGPHIFSGYWKNPEATAASIEPDGWFHSGDIGKLEDGFLFITGRKKEIIVTAAGKNVAPAVIEDGIRSHPLIGQAMVVGEGQRFIAAMVTIDPDSWPRFCEQNEISGSVAENVDNEVLKAAVQEAIDRGNKAVSRAESVREVRILPTDFSIEGGELTPSLKMKRNVVAEKYAGLIDEIFG
jgi:long-chain acyl-CoA synthetase